MQVQEEDTVYENKNHIWGFTGGHKEGYQLFCVTRWKTSLNETGHQNYNLSDLRASMETIIWGHSTTEHYYSGPPLQGYAGRQ